MDFAKDPDFDSSISPKQNHFEYDFLPEQEGFAAKEFNSTSFSHNVTDRENSKENAASPAKINQVFSKPLNFLNNCEMALTAISIEPKYSRNFNAYIRVTSVSTNERLVFESNHVLSRVPHAEALLNAISVDFSKIKWGGGRILFLERKGNNWLFINSTPYDIKIEISFLLSQILGYSTAQTKYIQAHKASRLYTHGRISLERACMPDLAVLLCHQVNLTGAINEQEGNILGVIPIGTLLNPSKKRRGVYQPKALIYRSLPRQLTQKLTFELRTLSGDPFPLEYCLDTPSNTTVHVSTNDMNFKLGGLHVTVTFRQVPSSNLPNGSKDDEVDHLIDMFQNLSINELK